VRSIRERTSTLGGRTMSNVVDEAAHKKRVQFRLRLQMIALVAAVIGVICFAIVLQGHVQSAILGCIGIAGVAIAVITLVWARIYSFVIIAKRPSPPRF
jgi:uncharacterized Tic20 family protein